MYSHKYNKLMLKEFIKNKIKITYTIQGRLNNIYSQLQMTNMIKIFFVIVFLLKYIL